MSPGSSPSGSPFHAGELEIQERLGVRARVGRFADKVIRDHLPAQHRAFYAQLPFVLLGSLDDRGRPSRGFMTSAVRVSSGRR